MIEDKFKQAEVFTKLWHAPQLAKVGHRAYLVTLDLGHTCILS